MGNIAASGSSDALSLFRSILLASAAIPGAFPPTLVTVEADDMGVPTQSHWYVLLYNPSSGYNCAILVKDSNNINYGKSSYIGIGIKAAGGSWHEDNGYYTTYAGPVYVHAPNTCVYLHTISPNIEWNSFAMGCN